MSKVTTPAILVNFKVYGEVEGAKSIEIARTCQKVAADSGKCIVVCPPTVELASVASAVDIPVLAQHVDDKEQGSNTGWITPQSVRGAGAVGTLLNHSEHRLRTRELNSLVEDCRKAQLQSVVCADNEASASKYARFHPDFIAVEPPELIGGDISVTEAKPEVVESAVLAVKRIDSHIPVLCGAGVKNGTDVKMALQLGASGVLLASGVVKARNVKKALEDLVQGI